MTRRLVHASVVAVLALSWVAAWVASPAPKVERSGGLPQLTLAVGPKQHVRLEDMLRRARERGVRDASASAWVKGTLSHEGEVAPCRIRLRGDNPNHWDDAKVSYRVKLKGEALYRSCREFNLIVPYDRGFFLEACGEWWNRALGLVPCRSELVEVAPQGVGSGVYAFVEELGKEQLEREGLPLGPVYKTWGPLHFTADAYLNRRRLLYSLPLYRVKCDAPGSAEVAALLEALLRQFRDLGPGDAPDLERVGQLLDLERWAAFSAACRVLGSHPEAPHNTILYFNPASGLFEPVLLDVAALQPRTLASFEAMRYPYELAPFVRDLLRAPAFRARRDRWLAQVVERGPDFLAEFDAYRAATVHLLDDPTLLLRTRQGLVRPSHAQLEGFVEAYRGAYRAQIAVCSSYLALSPAVRGKAAPLPELLALPDAKQPRVAHATLLRAADGRARLELRHTRSQPLELSALELSGDGAADVRVSPTPSSSEAGWSGVTLRWDPPLALPPGADLRLELEGAAGVQASPRVLEQGVAYTVARADAAELPDGGAVGWVVVAETSAEGVELGFLSESGEALLARASDLEVTREGDALRVAPGAYTVHETVVLPRRCRLELGPGTTLRFAPGASLVSYSPLVARGTAEQPVRLEGLTPGAHWGGLAVLSTNASGAEPSELEHVVVSGSRGAPVNGIAYTGGLSFFASDVRLRRCVFVDSGTDDALNVKRATLDVEGCVFVASPSDAVDADWCRGSIRDSLVLGCGGDGFDVSGARELELRGCAVVEAIDKAVSVGEASELSVRGCAFAGAAIGIASKDLSRTQSEGNVLLGVEASFAAYQKKPIFGPAELESAGDRLLGCGESQVEAGSRVSETQLTRADALDLGALRAAVRERRWAAAQDALVAALEQAQVDCPVAKEAWWRSLPAPK